MAQKYIYLDGANQIRHESMDNVKNSIFEGVYNRADELVTELIYQNRKVLLEQGARHSNEPISNIIAFLGERGTGKTSAMSSYVDFLRTFSNGMGIGNIKWGTLRNIENANEIKFVAIDSIDAAMLNKNESVVDILLAKMWNQFEKQLKAKVYVDDEYELLVEQVKKEFKNVVEAYSVQRKEKIENLPPISELNSLSVSMNLRDSLSRLVEKFARVIEYDSKSKGKETYLVIPIDDFDMGMKNTWFILEQVRRFLTIPKIIIFITADLLRLRELCTKHLEKNCEKKSNSSKKLSNDYIEKMLPVNMRIFMPQIGELSGMLEPDWIIRTENPRLRDLNGKTEKQAVFGMIVDKFGVYFDPIRENKHFLQQNTMRKLVNYLIGLNQVNQIEWLKDEYIYSGRQEYFDFDKKLMRTDSSRINESVIEYLKGRDNNLDYRFRDFGDVLYIFKQIHEWQAMPLDDELIDFMILEYTTICGMVYKTNVEGEWYQVVNNKLKEDIFGRNRLIGKGKEIISVYVTASQWDINSIPLYEIRNNICFTIERKQSKEEIEREGVTKFLTAIAPQLITLAVLLHFMDFDFTEENQVECSCEFKLRQTDQELQNDKDKNLTQMEIHLTGIQGNMFSFIYQEDQDFEKVWKIISKIIDSILNKFEWEAEADKLNEERDNKIKHWKSNDRTIKMEKLLRQNNEIAQLLKSPDILYGIMLEIGSFVINDIRFFDKELLDDMTKLYEQLIKSLKLRINFYAEIGKMDRDKNMDYCNQLLDFWREPEPYLPNKNVTIFRELLKDMYFDKNLLISEANPGDEFFE